MLRIVFSLLYLISTLAIAGGNVEALLATNPDHEAKKSFELGDRRYIVVPLCRIERGEVLPGWPLEYTPEHLKAITAGKHPISCKDFGDDVNDRIFVKVAKYAERYNQTLLQLSSNAKN